MREEVNKEGGSATHQLSRPNGNACAAQRTGSKNSGWNSRRTILSLTYNAGLRVSELIGLALEDLKMPTLDEVHIIGKGRRERILTLADARSLRYPTKWCIG